MINFQLRPYQEEDVNFMLKYRNVYNCLDMGLGKTLETLEYRRRAGFKKTLIMAPKIALGVWKNELEKFFGENSTIYTGTKSQRKSIWAKWDNDVLITNPAQIQEVLNLQNSWDLIIVDEAHLAGILNHKTKTYKVLEKAERESLILLCGTPIRRNPADLYGPLHLLNPKKFSSYYAFINKYCLLLDNGFGKEILPKPKNPMELRRMLDYYVIRRKKEDVLHDLPEKIRSVIPIEMTPKQAKAYKEMAEEMMLVESSNEMIFAASAMNVSLRLRQILVCPKMLGVDDYGTGIISLAEDLIPQDFEDKRSVIICTPFRKAIPYVKEYILQKIPDAAIFEIHGDIKETAAEVAARFQAHESHKKILIYTIKSGASFTATDASMVYFLGAEWSNVDNFQAEDRCYRIGQTRGVDVKYFCYNNTVDDEVKAALNNKSSSSHWVLNPVEMMKKLQKVKEKYVAKNK